MFIPPSPGLEIIKLVDTSDWTPDNPVLRIEVVASVSGSPSVVVRTCALDADFVVPNLALFWCQI